MSDLRFEGRMNDSDALALRIERDPVLRLTISALAVGGTVPRDPDADPIYVRSP